MTPLRATADLRGAVGDAHDAVQALAGAVRRLGERHAADHDVIHMARTLGAKLDAAADAIASEGRRLGDGIAPTDPDPARRGGPLAALRERASELTASRPSAGALLLADLRRFIAVAADASVACVVALQGAKASKDGALAGAVEGAQETVERTHRWALTRLEVTAPQVLTGP